MLEYLLNNDEDDKSIDKFVSSSLLINVYCQSDKISGYKKGIPIGLIYVKQVAESSLSC